jgi:protein disulfide-isomerase
MEADVFSKAAFENYAARNLVLVKLDFPRKTKLPAAEAAQNARLMQEFGVTGFPTVVVVNADRRKVAVFNGYVRGGPTAFLAALERQTGR